MSTVLSTLSQINILLLLIHHQVNSVIIKKIFKNNLHCFDILVKLLNILKQKKIGNELSDQVLMGYCV